VRLADPAILWAVAFALASEFRGNSAIVASARTLITTAIMGRQRRSNICGGIYHVMNRGNRKAQIFEDDRDRRRFLGVLVEELERYGVELLAGDLMGNHFHALVLTPHGNLSEFMAQWEGRFARYSNWRHDRVGHLFQGRFRDVLIEHDTHLLIALCYIFFNPVSAGLVERLEDYRWSTYNATVGFAPLPHYLSLDWLDTLFPGASREDAQRRLRSLMTNAKPVMTYLQGLEADPDAIGRALHSYVGEKFRLGTLPRLYRSLLRSNLQDLVQRGMPGPILTSAICEAHIEHGYTLREIARELRLHPSTVSKIFRSTRKLGAARSA
jgi:REP element-mobilizing transposase RayT